MIRLRRRLAPAPGGRRPRFTDGLVAGALIGAAIAGSTLWTRLRRTPRLDAPEPADAPASASPDADAALSDTEPAPD